MNLSDMSREQLIALVGQLKTSQNTRKLSLKVSGKGCVSIYGMNVRGVHLYAEQWQKVLDHADQIRAFIDANRDKLSWKTPQE